MKQFVFYFTTSCVIKINPIPLNIRLLKIVIQKEKKR